MIFPYLHMRERPQVWLGQTPGLFRLSSNTLWMALGVFEISEILINSSIFFIYCFEDWQYTPLAIQPQFRDWDIGLEPLMLLQVIKSYFPEAKGLFPVSHRLLVEFLRRCVKTTRDDARIREISAPFRKIHFDGYIASFSCMWQWKQGRGYFAGLRVTKP
jgi:hypothetical protein